MQEFDVCYSSDGYSTGDAWSLADYNGDLNGGSYHVLFIDMSATWWSTCYSQISFIDNQEEYWSEQNPAVKFITALQDLNQPYSCTQWGNNGNSGTPVIVEHDGTIFNWFHDSWNAYPSYVLIDHTMTVRAKPWSYQNNSNTSSCDGSNSSVSGWSGGNTNDFLQQLVDECGDCGGDGVDADGDGYCEISVVRRVVLIDH